MNRREFVERSAAAAVGVGVYGVPRDAVAQMPARPIGIQVGAVSFLDEGTDKVLDTLADLGGIDTLFLATFTYGRGIGGRQPRGSAAARPRQAGVRRRLSRRQLRNAACPVLQEQQHRAAEGARPSRLRRHRRRAAARAQARHEGDLLVRGRVPQGRARPRQGLRGGRSRQAGGTRLLPQSEHDELLAGAHRGLSALV